MKKLKPGGLVTHRPENKNPNFETLVSEASNMLMSLQIFHCLLLRNQITLHLQKREQWKSGLLLCF